jgi:hypothetical protein
MNAQREPDLEDALRTQLPALAPSPSAGILNRSLAAVAKTPQRRSPAMARAAWGSPWRWAAASVAVAAGIVVGVVIGTSTPSPSPPPGASVVPFPSIDPSGQVGPLTWERLDLPDPAPGVFSFSQPSDVVAFDGGYVAVGSVDASCSSDIAEAPPGCDAALNALPATQSAAVWRSDDGRAWELLPYDPAFDSARMRHAATDGSRIVVSGVVLSLNEFQPVRPVIWVSNDGRGWELIETDGPVPDWLVSTDGGFVGVRSTDDGLEFLASDDGRSWRATTQAGDQGAGEVMGMTVGHDGRTVVVVGYSPRIVATSWVSRDGETWERAPDDEDEGTWMSAAAETDAGWVAVGLDQLDETIGTENYPVMAAWTSPDGIAWTRVPSSSIDLVTEADSSDAMDVAWTGGVLVASGEAFFDGPQAVAAFWLSSDGTSWDAVTGQPALDDGRPHRLVAFEDLTMALGVRAESTHHLRGVVWLVSP